MRSIIVIAASVFAIASGIFFCIRFVRTSHISGPATICLALSLAILFATPYIDFPDDMICSSCNKEIYTVYCTECGSQGILRRYLFQD